MGQFCEIVSRRDKKIIWAEITWRRDSSEKCVFDCASGKSRLKLPQLRIGSVVNGFVM